MTEQKIVNATPGTPIKSQTELESEAILVTGGKPVIHREPQPSATDFSNIQISAEERAGRAHMEAFLALPEDQQKARIAVVLDRGMVHDRLKVDMPPDLHGEWARNDPLYIDHMRTLGFWVDDTYATRRALHNDGTSSNIVGDVIHMVTTRVNKQMIDKVRNEQQLRSARVPKEAPEETQGRDSVPHEIPTFSESTQRSVTTDDVRAAINRANKQTVLQR